VKNTKSRAEQSVPNVTNEQLEQLKSKLAAAGGESLLTPGSVSDCPDCGGKMVTTNNLEETVAAPGLVFVVTRLPGARCVDCGATELDGAAVGILEATLPRGILADYETAVTHSSSKTLGTYFKMDLARVLRLTGNERLFWKVVDKDQALVRVDRARSPAPARATPARSRSNKRRVAA
jgi:hypothetical protein